MIRSPLGLRLDPSRPVRDQIRGAARLGARGVVFDAAGDLGPDRVSETGRRELRHLLRSVELDLVAVNLPTRRPFDTLDQLEDRLRRADSAFAMAYDLGTRLVLARAGALPSAEDAERRSHFALALAELGRRADHRGVRFAIEAGGTEPGSALAGFLDGLNLPTLAVSLDPSALLGQGIDPVAAVRELDVHLAHAYANDASGTSRTFVANPRGVGFPPGALDWEEYLGALEEVNYRGFLTVWPEPGRDPGSRFAEIAARLRRF